MKLLGSIVAIVILGYLGTFIGWWGIALIAGIVGFIAQIHGSLSFLGGFVGGALFFFIYTYSIDSANEGMLSSMMTEALKFNPFWPTVLIGALLGAMGMLTGKYARDVIFGEQRMAKYRGKYK